MWVRGDGVVVAVGTRCRVCGWVIGDAGCVCGSLEMQVGLLEIRYR